MTLVLNGTTGVSAVDGSASTPAIQGNDSNTGIFFPAADTIAFAEGGAEVARFDSSGNFGLGTSSPNASYRLDVNGGVLARNNSAFTQSSINTSLVVTYEASNGNSVRTSQTQLSTGGFIWNNDVGGNGPTDYFAWQISGSERARIDSSGNLLVGKTATAFGTTGVVLTAGESTMTNASNTVLSLNRTGTDGAIMGFAKAGTFVGSIGVTASATAYNTSSDYRLKHDIAPMTGALARVAALKPVTYKWNADDSAGEGFIAHELAEVCPQAVTGEKDATRMEQYEISPAVPATYDEEGNELTPAVEAVMGEREVPVYQGIDTSFLVATLTAAIQEQQAMIQQLQAEVAALKGAQA